MAIQLDTRPLEPPDLQPSTSRTSLEDLHEHEMQGRSQEATRGTLPINDKNSGPWAIDAVAREQLYGSRSPSSAKGKGKEREWDVELDVVAGDGSRSRVRSQAGDVVEGESEDEQDEESDTDGTSLSTAEGITAVEQTGSLSPRDKPQDGIRPSPPPAPPPPLPPATPSTSTTTPPLAEAHLPKTLHPILKRPQPARLHSSQTSDGPSLSFSPSLPSTHSRSNSAVSPSLLTSYIPELSITSARESPPSEIPALLPSPSKETRHPVFSALDRRSTIGDDKEAGTGSGATSGGGNGHIFDPTATIRSWKSSFTGRRNPDKKRLAALGFEEEFPRDYDFWASFGISLCNIGGLPGCVLGVLTALQTGGGSMYAVAWPLSGLFMCCVAAVLGEMVSTWPVAGAMFTWVFRLSRSIKALDPWARYLSWITGSFLLCSHILLQIIITWQLGHNLLGVVALYTSKEYSFWVTVAICWGICIFSALVNSSNLSRSPWLWRCGGWFIIIAFIIINVTLLVQSSQVRSATYVFTSYYNDTGFDSKAYVYMLGWVLTCVATGMEASAHTVEDTINPSRTVPLAMFWSVAATYLMGWISICVLLATVDTVGLRPDLQASIALIDNSLPRRYATIVLVLVLVSLVFQNIAQLLATSRFIWALARESALPFSPFFRRLSSKHKQPLPAIWVTIFIAVPTLLFLAIDSHIFATTLLEGAGISVVLSWIIPILIYLACSRDVLRGDGRAQWTLRRASKPMASAAAIFCGVFLVMVCLPTGYPVTPLNVSYAAAVWFGVTLMSTAAWIVYGNRHYAGPIKTTTRWTIGAEVDLPSSSSRDAATKKKSTARAHITTSAQHGRSAHVFAVSGEETDDDDDESREGGVTRESEWTRDSRDVETGVTGTGSEWTEYTDEEGEETDESDEGGEEGGERAVTRERERGEERSSSQPNRVDSSQGGPQVSTV